MSINSNNIDKWLFDYYEGNLSPDDIRKLEQFLKKNPEYYEDAEAWKDSFVEESVPVFNTTFLVKETEPAGNRRKLAYAAILLLLLSTSAAIYYLIPSGSDQDNHSSSTGSMTENTNQIGFSAPLTTNRHVNEHVSVVPVNNQENNTLTSGLSFAPDMARLQEMANHYHETGLDKTPFLANTNQILPVNNQVTFNRNTTNGQQRNIETNAVQANHTVTLVTHHNTANLTNNDPGINVTDNNSPFVSNNNVPNNNGTVNTNNGVESNVVMTEIDPQLTEVKISPLNNVLTEDINLTVEEKVAENKNQEKTSEKDRTSDLNPDALMAKAKKEEDQNKIAENEKPNKTDIPLPKGIGFTNRRQVTLLQGINNDFENNASFISQHYMLDAYSGTHFVNASPIENGFAQMIGASQYFRKAKTTVNVYGTYNKTGYIQQAALNLQMAMHFKLDRYQSIIPAVSVSATQYKFEDLNMNYPTFLPVDYNNIPSYSAGLLTGTPNYYGFKDGTKMNLSASALYHHKKFYAALALNGLLQPKFKYDIFDRKGTAVNYATVNMVVGTDFVSKKYPELSLSPQLMVSVRNLEADFAGGAVLRYKSWGVGAGMSSTGALNTYAGYTHRAFTLQYRFMYDKLDAPFKGVNGHYLTAHFNLKSFVKKQKPILDSEK